MTKAQFFQIPGPLGEHYQKNGFSHAATLPPQAQIVVTAGEPGINVENGQFSTDPRQQISAAFDNCESALRSAGVKDGLAAAFKVTCFLLDVAHEPIVMEVWRRRQPDVRPAWMTIGVNALCSDKMLVEMQIEAYKGHSL